MKIESEKNTIRMMIGIYCRRKHQSQRGELCDDCCKLLEYALRRLDNCPHGDAKPTCRKCRIHCYAPAQRQLVRDVMRYVGPRMMLINPIAAIRHLLNEIR